MGISGVGRRPLLFVRAGPAQSSVEPYARKDDRIAHVLEGIRPAFYYILERIVDGGVRFAAVELLRAFGILNPSIHHMDMVPTLSCVEAFALIESVITIPSSVVESMLEVEERLECIHQNAIADGKKDSSAILTWHYNYMMFLRIDQDEADDTTAAIVPETLMDAPAMIMMI